MLSAAQRGQAPKPQSGAPKAPGLTALRLAEAPSQAPSVSTSSDDVRWIECRLLQIIALVVFWRLRYRLTLRDLAEMFLQRGIVFSHEAVREWEARLAPVLADELRRRRHGRGGTRAATGTWMRRI